MSSTSRQKGRSIGLLYLLSAVPGAFSIIYIPAAFVVPGDATATARRITDGELIYRVGIASDLLSMIMWVLLVVGLYGLLKDVDKKYATLMAISASVIVPIGVVDTVTQVAPLILLGGADHWSTFSKPQLDALVMGLISLRINGLVVASAFWGLWLVPFGILVMRSGFFPKILGVLLIVAGIAYLASSFASILLPAQRQVVSLVALPFYAIGEVSIIVWLLAKGARVPLPDAPSRRGVVVP